MEHNKARYNKLKHAVFRKSIKNATKANKWVQWGHRIQNQVHNQLYFYVLGKNLKINVIKYF